MHVHCMRDISRETTVILFTPAGDCKRQDKLLVTKQTAQKFHVKKCNLK